MVMGIKVFVDPLMFPWAESFYYQGLLDLFGKQNVEFNPSYFVDIPNNPARPNTFNFIIWESDKTTRYAIDWFDANTINNKHAYDWCDVYGKVNLNWSVTPLSEFGKLVPVPPSMGIKCHSLSGAICDLVSNCSKAGILLKKDFVRYARYYYREYNRLPLDSYQYNPDLVQNGYVFFLNTLWYNANWNDNDERLNTPRYNIMKYVNELPFVDFDGGFVAHNKRNVKNGYESSDYKYGDFVVHRRVKATEYMNKLTKSFVALNTGGVVSCFGWKLAEYLAKGKAIVSLPFVNNLAVPLEHGKNIHFVECDRDSIQSALIYIYENQDYRMELERGSRLYWETYCKPSVVIYNLMNS